MAKVMFVLRGVPDVSARSLNRLKAFYGDKKGLEVWIRAAAVSQIGWDEVERQMTRKTALSWRRDFLEAGILAG